MPRAEKGTPKDLANRMKSKGLQRLRWYCQACEKQCRDENGFKCHTMSESHLRQMNHIAQNPGKHINEFSQQFKHDFLQLLRTSHGEKPVQFNHFYQEYIRDKNHVHMNGTKWKSLSEFCKYLGREGICRVEDSEKGLFIAWIDNSPDALKRKDAIARRDRMTKNDEEREQQLLKQQIERSKQQKKDIAPETPSADDTHTSELKRDDHAAPIKLGFSLKKSSPPPAQAEGSVAAQPRRSNIFANVKAASGAAQAQRPAPEPVRPLSAAERIMMQEQARERRKADRPVGLEFEQRSDKRVRT